MALRHSAFYSPYLMTFVESFLKDEGLTANYKVATPDCQVDQSIIDGSCHVAQSAVATRLADLDAGINSDIVHFSQINERDGFYLAAREKDDNFNWKKLIAKDVLVDHFFQPHAMFSYALKKQGVAEAELNIIDAGDVDQIEKAFRDGQGDYVHMQGPYPQQLEKEGVGHVVASVGEVIGPVAFSSLCCHRNWLETDMSKAFLKAYQKSMDYVISAPAEELARKQMEVNLFPGIDVDVLTETISSYQKLGCWNQNTEISKQSFDTLIDVFLSSGYIKNRFTQDQVV